MAVRPVSGYRKGWGVAEVRVGASGMENPESNSDHEARDFDRKSPHSSFLFSCNLASGTVSLVWVCHSPPLPPTSGSGPDGPRGTGPCSTSDPRSAAVGRGWGVTDGA